MSKKIYLNGYSAYIIEYSKEKYSELIIADSIERIYQEHFHRNQITKIEKLPLNIFLFGAYLKKDDEDTMQIEFIK